MRPIPILASAVALLVVATASAGSQPAESDPSLRLVLITAPATSALGDGDLLIAGASEAARTLGATLDIRVDAGGRALDDAIAAAGGADAVGLVDPSPDVVAPGRVPVGVLDRGVSAGSLGAAFVLQADPALAGAGAVEQLTGMGARHILCLIDESGVPALAARCAGAVDAAPDGVSVDTLWALDPDGDPTGITAAITARIIAQPTIDAVLLARVGVEVPARAALDSAPDGRSRLLAVVGPRSDDSVADLGVDPRSREQGWILVVGLALAAAGGGGTAEDARPRVVAIQPHAWP